MNGEYPEFDIDMTFDFKIILNGEETVESTANETASANETESATVTDEHGNATSSATSENSAQPGDPDFEFEWDYANADTGGQAAVMPLEVDFYSINPTGLLYIEFSKPFIPPQIHVQNRD